MLRTICNNKGFSLLETLIASAILVIGVLGVLAVFPQAYMASAKSDNIGRAAEILHRTLENAEMKIMNPTCAVTVGTTTSYVYSSGQSTPKQGDLTYTVSQTIASVGTNIWRVTVQVTWPANSTGIKESLIVTRQDAYNTQTCS